MGDEGDAGEVMDRGGRGRARWTRSSPRPECLLVSSWCDHVGDRGERSSCEKRLFGDELVVFDWLLGRASECLKSEDDLRLLWCGRECFREPAAGRFS